MWHDSFAYINFLRALNRASAKSDSNRSFCCYLIWTVFPIDGWAKVFYWWFCNYAFIVIIRKMPSAAYHTYRDGTPNLSFITHQNMFFVVLKLWNVGKSQCKIFVEQREPQISGSFKILEKQLSLKITCKEPILQDSYHLSWASKQMNGVSCIHPHLLWMSSSDGAYDQRCYRSRFCKALNLQMRDKENVVPLQWFSFFEKYCPRVTYFGENNTNRTYFRDRQQQFTQQRWKKSHRIPIGIDRKQL